MHMPSDVSRMRVIRRGLPRGPKNVEVQSENPHVGLFGQQQNMGEGGGQGHNNVRRGRGSGKEKGRGRKKGKYGERGERGGEGRES